MSDWRLELTYHTRAEPRGSRPFELTVTTGWQARRTGLFGPSGSGKSTLLSLLLGLAPREQVQGRARRDGQLYFDTAAGLWPSLPARKLGWMPQGPSLFPHLTVRGNIAFAARERRAPYAADELTSFLELDGMLDKFPWQLSGGEQQRVALARALAAVSEALLLDEPLTSLDKPRRQQLLGWIRRVSDHFQKPLLFVSHEWDEIAELCEHVLVLRDGKLEESRPP
jgi:molybdate transport system ATP-binding protein